MGQFITHACGHGQAHCLTGFASQQERKARWLQTTKCRTCFIADKQSEQAASAARDGAATAHLELPPLTGSERQVAWAATIRAGRLASLVGSSAAADTDTLQTCHAVTDAKWWIDHRNLSHADLLAKARIRAGPACSAPEMPSVSIAQAAKDERVPSGDEGRLVESSYSSEP